jgi:hypothetical protein
MCSYAISRTKETIASLNFFHGHRKKRVPGLTTFTRRQTAIRGRRTTWYKAKTERQNTLQLIISKIILRITKYIDFLKTISTSLDLWRHQWLLGNFGDIQSTNQETLSTAARNIISKWIIKNIELQMYKRRG